MSRKSKGISPLIATVLLIAFTIAVGGILSVWITTFTRDQADEQTVKGDKASICSDSVFFFSKNDVNVTAGVLKIVISNEGRINQTDYDVYALLDNGNLRSNTTPLGYTTVQPGEKVQITADVGDATFTSKDNMTNLRVTLGPSDQCAGKEYKVDF